MKLTLGFSPCPNDTFIFDALVNKKIDTGGLDFEVVLEDVETLNKWAKEGKLDITKLSFPAFFQSLDNYILLNSGSALGKGVGPILITNTKQRILTNEIDDKTIFLPGENTTANLLFSFAYPCATNKSFILFSEIEEAVLGIAGSLGVIIHENRFTYEKKGLQKIIDLGEYWEKKMNVPIPLGGIAIKRNSGRLIHLQVDSLIRKSLEYAFVNYPAITSYVKEHSQSMSEDVMRKHIDLYVNQYSLNLGAEGTGAIKTLYEVYCSMNNAGVESDISLFL
ncbi:MAG: 1,4-dihydroxy-6-naphthoate synthase [Chitinophagaceae bacterium]|nr:1,4-dihydroxy-6-naphthoate synthase [Chitinophagaceae bacterium]